MDEGELARFRAAMDDDFNTPDALAVMQGVARDLNLAKAAGDPSEAALAAGTLRALGAILGILQQDPDAYLKRSAGIEALSDAQVEATAGVAARGTRAPRISPNRIGSAPCFTARVSCSRIKPGGGTEWRRA